jgi:hypothetical protein
MTFKVNWENHSEDQIQRFRAVRHNGAWVWLMLPHNVARDRALPVLTSSLEPAGADHAPGEPDPQERGDAEADDREHVQPEDVRPRVGEDADEG